MVSVVCGCFGQAQFLGENYELILDIFSCCLRRENAMAVLMFDLEFWFGFFGVGRMGFFVWIFCSKYTSCECLVRKSIGLILIFDACEEPYEIESWICGLLMGLKLLSLGWTVRVVSIHEVRVLCGL
jgi:hypothetical protein